jgi:PKD repeat protein
VRLTSSAKSPRVGEIVTVLVEAELGTGDADAIGVYLDFSPSLFEVVDEQGRAAATIQASGSPFTTVNHNQVDNARGRINFVASGLDDPVSGTFTVATVRLRTKAKSNRAQLSFASSLERPSGLALAGQPLTAELAGLTLSIGGGGQGSSCDAPKASFKAKRVGRTLDVTFSGRAESDPSCGPLTLQWSFGDGSSSTVNPTSHTYAAAGRYEVSFSVADREGQTATARKIVVLKK